ncbi:MAG: helix-turn-helix domain-containing protein [Nitrospinaceae bacterium]|jgi:excisionase family DNA binding protein|nr:helix-turn-helix domain-containing protein [Nitrospinaceae bacterium]|tara:strand:+ start:1038 stop:1235 length:198 start_codon:yes stop_codon:yes gene_type:complete
MPNDDIGKQTITVRELSKVLGVSLSKAYEAVHSGSVPSIKIGKRIVIPVPALNTLLSEGRKGEAV